MNKKEKRLNLWLKDKNFEKKYLKNIIVNICHGQSTTAKTESCYFCSKGVSKKELKSMNGYSYGYQFGDFENKRHRFKKSQFNGYSRPKEFLKNVCMECLGELEKKLDFVFVKIYAP